VMDVVVVMVIIIVYFHHFINPSLHQYELTYTISSTNPKKADSIVFNYLEGKGCWLDGFLIGVFGFVCVRRDY